MASELRVTTIANNAGTESVDTTYVINGSAKAYARTGYSSGTPQTTDLFNISSFTDTNTGRMSVNFTSSFNNTNYNRFGTASLNETANYYCQGYDDGVGTTSAVPMAFVNMNNAFDDPQRISIAFYGDLA